MPDFNLSQPLSPLKLPVKIVLRRLMQAEECQRFKLSDTAGVVILRIGAQAALSFLTICLCLCFSAGIAEQQHIALLIRCQYSKILRWR